MPSAGYVAMRAYHHYRLLCGRLRGRRDRWQGVRILGYHRLAEADDSLSVSPHTFRRHMEMVLESGAPPISLDRALQLLAADVDDRHVCVTFDDGYLDNLEHGVPVLRELNIPATIFLPTRVIEGHTGYFWYSEPPPAMSWEQIRPIASASGGLIGFQSHTHTHSWLPDLCDADVAREFTESKALIERHTGKPVTSIAYPGGLYGAREQLFVSKTGYEAGITTDPGVNRGGGELTALKRTLIYREDGLSGFVAKLSGLLDGPARLRGLLYDRIGPGPHSSVPRQDHARSA